MKRYRGREKVEAGVYVNAKQLSFKSLEEPGRLPGTEQDEYWQVPPVALLLAGPILGLVYVIFLPFVGLVMVAWIITASLAEAAAAPAMAFLRVLRPAWQPATAFLSRVKAARKGKKRDAWLEKAKKELENEGKNAA